MKFDLSHLKGICICCEKKGEKSSKEHIFPKWLLKKTNTYDNPITWIGLDRKIPGKDCVIPICEECNNELGIQLENPVSQIFERIENGLGFNDHEAELLVRWMWKMNGMFHWMVHPRATYSDGNCTLKERALSGIIDSRDRISIAVSLIKDSSEDFVDHPLGLDVLPRFSNVLTAGVFLNIAIIVFYTVFRELIPNDYTIYTLSSVPLLMNPNYKIYPKCGFTTGSDAVGVTFKTANDKLLLAHEILVLEALRNKEVDI